MVCIAGRLRRIRRVRGRLQRARDSTRERYCRPSALPHFSPTPPPPLSLYCDDLMEFVARATRAASSGAAVAAAPTRGTSPTKLSVPAHSHLSPIIRRIDSSSSNDIPRRCLEMSTSELPCVGVGEDRLLPHPDDCELFYYCVGDVAICRQCPSGLHFSPTQHVCERAARAGCDSALALPLDQE
ncbi:hypothetical protein RR48_02421 [Papilio machaon]|uniref:Chitin-binding type-2 domain-containing protein n=1 Tax=Papilio machaon TaxID=76193 RepID=A0A0N1ICU3_PAPMA|nr:hypothetical protein RR48_02421 [Papilio machaon]